MSVIFRGKKIKKVLDGFLELLYQRRLLDLVYTLNFCKEILKSNKSTKNQKRINPSGLRDIIVKSVQRFLSRQQ